MAAITHRVTTPDTGATPNASGAFTPVANDVLVVAIQCAASVSDSDDVPTASANGITFVRINHALYRTSLDSVDLYIANQFVPSNPVSMTVSWAPTDAGDGTVITVLSTSAMKRTGSSAVKQQILASNLATGIAPAATFGAACLTDNPVIGAVGNSTNPAGLTPPSSWTERADSGYATPTSGMEVASIDSGFTGSTVTWGSNSGSAHGVALTELDASVPNGPQIEIFKTPTLTSTAATQDLVITGCLDGDLLVALFGGDNFSTEVTAASAATQAGPGTTGSWTETVEVINGSTDSSWGLISEADVTGDGDVTVRLARTQSSAQPWAGYVARCRNSSGVGNFVHVAQSATEVGSITTSAESAVLELIIDWDNLAEGNSIFTPNDALYIERNNATGVAFWMAYWLGQPSGTRNYGINGTSSSTALRVFAIEVLAASGSTPVGKELGLLWNTRAAVADTSQLIWNTRAALSDTVQAIWHVRSKVPDELSLLWDLKAPIGDTIQALWNVKAAAGDTTQLVWDVRAAVGDTINLPWNIRTTVHDSVQALWSVRTLVGNPLELLWHIKSSAGDSVALIWHTRAFVGDSDILLWHVKAAVADSLQVVWDVQEIGINAVGKNFSMLWDAKSWSGKDLQATWHTRSIVSDTINFQWGIRVAIGKSRGYVWSIRVTASDVLVLVWNVDIQGYEAVQSPVSSVRRNSAVATLGNNTASTTRPNTAEAFVK